MNSPERRGAYHWRCRHSVKVDLAAHLSVCEFNYRAFIRLLPQLHEGREHWHFGLGMDDKMSVRISVLEASPYTSLIGLTQSQGPARLPEIRVRLYHDAELAEVVAWQEHRYWQPSYDYPNERMYQPDEKLALNRFIGDWLAFCRKTGFTQDPNCDSVLVSGK